MDIEKIATTAYNAFLTKAGVYDDADYAGCIADFRYAIAATEAFGAVAHTLGLCEEFEFLGLEHSNYGHIRLNGELVKVRIADHARQSVLHAAAAINIVVGADKGGDDFESICNALAANDWQVDEDECTLSIDGRTREI